MKNLELLQTSKVEKDVENAWRTEFIQIWRNASITSPFGSDGYLVVDNITLLMEVKFNKILSDKKELAPIIAQAVYYLKKFEDAGKPIPKTVFIGDINECCVVAANNLTKYLNNSDINWTLPPSSPDIVLTLNLIRDENIHPYIFNVDKQFNFKEVTELIEKLCSGECPLVKATPKNIDAMFAVWNDTIFVEELDISDKVDVFLHTLFYPDDVYVHPKKENLLVIKDKQIKIKSSAYKAFFSRFKQGYSPIEIDAVYAIKDQLIDEARRRMRGEFFTPKIWVDLVHEYVTKIAGENWKEECLVIDPAYGTANITRDYHFNNLILSTIDANDVAIIREQKYNDGATIEQWDFLNDAIPAKIKEKLEDAKRDGKKVVWVMNPPFGTAGNNKTDGESKAGITTTKMNEEMKAAKMGAASAQLYAQFFYRVTKIMNEFGLEGWMGSFSVPIFMTGPSFKMFRTWWEKHWGFSDGFLVPAKGFSEGIKGDWGVAFTCWQTGVGDNNAPKRLNLYRQNPITLEPEHRGVHSFYNTDGVVSASEWVKSSTKLEKVDEPLQSSGLEFRQDSYGDNYDNALGCLESNANNVQSNPTYVALYSVGNTRAHSLPIFPDNFLRCIALFTARKLIAPTWISEKDEYLAPASGPEYDAWLADAVVYSLFHTSNNATAVRDVPHKGKLYRIKNNFFWHTRDYMRELANTSSFHACYHDVQNEQEESYLATLGVHAASEEARRVMEMADALLVKSMPKRISYHELHPEYNLQSWNAGWYQLKYLWRDCFPDEFKELRVAYKALEELLRPGVFQIGFLRGE